MYHTTPSPALDVLHHQHGKGRFRPLLHCFRGTGRNVDMTNEIQARVIINSSAAIVGRSPTSREKREVGCHAYTRICSTAKNLQSNQIAAFKWFFV